MQTNWVPIKKFQSNMYEYMDKLPVVLTKRGMPFAILARYDAVGYQGASEGLADMATVVEGGKPTTDERTPLMGIRPIEMGPVQYEVVTEAQEEKQIEVCEHGRMKGLCEHGCK